MQYIKQWFERVKDYFVCKTPVVNTAHDCEQRILQDVSPYEEGWTREEEDALFDELAEVEGFYDFLKATESRDLKRYFGASKEQQEAVRGAFGRTRYLRRKLKDANEKKTDKVAEIQQEQKSSRHL